MSDSMWKKEISFKRKPKGDAEPPAAEKQSFWKKEISLSRKGKDDDTWEIPETPKQSFLKKEISFSRKPKRDQRDSEVERLAQEAARAVTPGPVEAPLPPPTELAEAVVAAMPDPIAPAPVPYVHAVADLPATTEIPAEPWAGPTPVPEPEPAEAWLAAAELPPVPETAVVPVVHPPVPAAELPPLLQPVTKTPFWKKELSLSRGTKAPKPERQPKVKGTPFWKKELSLGRKRGPAVAAEAPMEQLPAAKAATSANARGASRKGKAKAGRKKRR